MNIGTRRAVAWKDYTLSPLAAMSGLHATELCEIGAELDPDVIARPKAESWESAYFAHVNRVVTLDRDVPYAAALRRRARFEVARAHLNGAEPTGCLVTARRSWRFRS